MSPKSTDPSTPTLTEHLEQDLAAATAKENFALQQVEEAKSLLSTARDESKRLRKIIELYSGKPSPALTKKNIRPYVLRLLADGQLPEKEVVAGLEKSLRDEGRSLTGLSLVVRPLRTEFASEDGLWSVEDPQAPSPAKSPSEVEGSRS